MGNEMKEALEAIEGEVKLAKPKIPDGSTLIGIQLQRDNKNAGRYMEGITRYWRAFGIAIAIRDGHVIAGNPIFGRVTRVEKGDERRTPKVSAMHWVKCNKCGSRTAMPLAVWAAKDRTGGENFDGESGRSILDKHGLPCDCNAGWTVDAEGEKDGLARFADEVLRTFSAVDVVPRFIPPAAFNVGVKPSPLGEGWEWLEDALRKAGKSVAPYDPNVGIRDTLVYNPGFWIGYVEDYNSTGLFWVENGKRKPAARAAFNAGAVEGL